MCPAVGIYQSPKLFFYQMILAKAIGNQNSFVILIEFKRKLMVPAFLLFIDNHWELCMEFTGAMHPHIAFASGSSVIVDYLGGRLIRLCHWKL